MKIYLAEYSPSQEAYHIGETDENGFNECSMDAWRIGQQSDWIVVYASTSRQEVRHVLKELDKKKPRGA